MITEYSWFTHPTGTCKVELAYGKVSEQINRKGPKEHHFTTFNPCTSPISQKLVTLQNFEILPLKNYILFVWSRYHCVYVATHMRQYCHRGNDYLVRRTQYDRLSQQQLSLYQFNCSRSNSGLSTHYASAVKLSWAMPSRYVRLFDYVSRAGIFSSKRHKLKSRNLQCHIVPIF